MVRWRRDKHLRWPTAILVGALSAGTIVSVPGLARAEGFIDFLFGGNQQRQAPPPDVSSYAAPQVRPAPLAALAPAGPQAPHHVAG